MIYLQVIVITLLVLAALTALYAWREERRSQPDDPLWMWWFGLSSLFAAIALLLALLVGAYTLVAA